MTQKIVGRRDGGRRAVLFMLRSAAAGVAFAFGVSAGVFFTLPTLKKCFPLKGNDREEVALGRDEQIPETEAAAAETSAQTAVTETAAGTTEPPAAEITEEELGEALSSYVFTFEEYLKVRGTINEQAEAADMAVAEITLHSELEEPDHLKEASCTGIAVQLTDSELLLLAPDDAAVPAARVTAAFPGSQGMTAEVRSVDTLSGLSVLSVPITAENRETIKKVRTIGLGNSYQMRRGDLVFLVGAPLGVLHSVDYAEIGGIRRQVSVTDGSAELFYTKGPAAPDLGTWVINTDGKLIGWATGAFEANCTTILGISDFKPMLERMMNGTPAPLLGIRAVNVSAELHAEGLPIGIYITGVVKNSPSYVAGIQPGDIVRSINGSVVTTLRDYAMAMDKLAPEETARIVISRRGRDDYAEIEFEVKTGKR